MDSRDLAVEMPLFLTLEQAAAVAQRSPNALRVLRTKGKGPRFRKVDGRLLVSRSDLTAWLSGDVPPAA
jgi:hypothetical protein